jgi:hypothetical protein
MLKYRFIAHFTDGTTFEQNPDDVSLLDPKRSSFYDLQQELSAKTLHSFTIFNDEHTYAVDLLDGHFEIDGLAIWASPKDLPAIPDRFELIYYRQHTHAFGLDGVEQTHDIRFCFGWKCNLSGRSYQQTIGVD